MVAVTVVLVVIALIVLVLCVWLGDGRAKGVVILGFLSGILVSATGFATWLRDQIVALLT